MSPDQPRREAPWSTSAPSVPTDQQPTALPPAARLALDAYEREVAHLGGHGPILVAWAPGRVNLIGEHTDYNGGWVLPVAVDRAIAIAGRADEAGRVRLFSRHHQARVTFLITSVELARPVRRMPLWGRYIRAVLAELSAGERADDAAPENAFFAAVAGDVPVGGGMSSSAALTVATATFAGALGWPQRDPLATARLAQAAEQQATGVRIGLMDQAISCLGRADHALLLDCRSQTYRYVPAPFGDVALVSFDTGVARSLAGSAYNQRRWECEEATRLIAHSITAEQPQREVATLRDVTQEDLNQYGAGLPDVSLRRARHVVTENARVLRAAEALERGDLQAVGRLVAASHASLRDDFAVSCPELDAAVEIASAVPGVFGARMTGAGFGGSTLILVTRSALPRLEQVLRDEYPRRTGRSGTLHVCAIADGPALASVAPSASRGA